MAPAGHGHHGHFGHKNPVVRAAVPAKGNAPLQAVAAPLQGLYRVKCIRNPKYKPDGLKSLGHLVRKFDFIPTLPCPFTVIQTLTDDTTKNAQKLIGNPKPPGAAPAQATQAKVTKAKPAHVVNRMARRDGTGQTVQNDASDSTDGDQAGPSSSSPHTVSRVMKKDNSGKPGQVAAEDVQNDSEYLAQSTSLPAKTQSKGKSNGHTIFDPSKSSTFKNTNGSTWQIQYGDGSTAGGSVSTDTVVVGGLSVENQAVELASKLAQSFEDTDGDGLLGLAFGSINTVQPAPVHTPVENMMTQSDIPADSQLFTAYLTNYRDNDPPSYTFGYIDQDLVKGKPISYTPIDNSQGFWQVKSAMTIINGKKFPNAGNTAIMDTGTTLSLIDDTTCKNIYAAIPGSSYNSDQGGFIFPSNCGKDKLPVIQFGIGDALVTIDKDDLAFQDLGNGMMFGGIQSRGSMGFSIYGGTVLKSMYAIFDQGRKQFGFAQKAVN